MSLTADVIRMPEFAALDVADGHGLGPWELGMGSECGLMMMAHE